MNDRLASAYRDFLAWPMLAAGILLLVIAGAILVSSENDAPALGYAEALSVIGAVLIGSWVAMLAAGIGGEVVTGNDDKEGPDDVDHTD